MYDLASYLDFFTPHFQVISIQYFSPKEVCLFWVLQLHKYVTVVDSKKGSTANLRLEGNLKNA